MPEMKKALKLIARIIGLIILIILLAAILIPSLFKEQIKEKVVSVANEKVNAELYIGDFGITLFRNFPNLTFRLKNVSITGVDKFRGDTLAGFKSFNLVFDLGSIFSKEGYRIRSIDLERPVARATILEDGSASYDIALPTDTVSLEDEPSEKEKEADGKKLMLNLNRFTIRDADISYYDYSSGMEADINDLDLLLKGDLSTSYTNLYLETSIGDLNFALNDIRMLNSASLSASFDVEANLEDNEFILGENRISLNELLLLFTGSVRMEDKDIIADLNIGTGDTGFKSVLSMIPAVYMKGFEELQADGEFTIKGAINGRYSAADSVLPDVNINFGVNDGKINYPDLPGSLDNINILTSIEFDGTDPDKSVLDLQKFHFDLAGNPFEMKMLLLSPISDPDLNAAFNGKIDLEALASAVPVELNKLKGLIDIGLELDGKLSMIERQDFESFRADGNMRLSGFEVEMDNLPPLGIEVAELNFSPQFTSLDQLKIDAAGNKINISGRLENYLPYLFKGETVYGSLDLYSAYLDMDTIFSYMPDDTVEETEEDTVKLSSIRLPENIDFKFISVIEDFRFSPLEATDLRGNIALSEGVLRISETGLSSLGGRVLVNAQYDSRDSLNPYLASSLEITGIGIEESFNTFNTVRQLAPVAKGMDGTVSVDFEFSSLLGEGMMPVIQSINGKGRLRSEQIQLISSPVYDKASSVLQIGEEYTNEFRDVDLSFEVKDGRIYVSPFNTRLGDMKLNVSGDHGIDQTINYILKVEVPASKLPPGMNALLTGLAAKAALMGIEYYQPEVININVLINGTVLEPQVLPSLGQSTGQSVKETVKEKITEIAGDKVEEVKEQLSEETRRQVDKIMAEAEEKADRLKAEAALAAGKIRDEAEKNANKLVSEASDKGALARMAAERAAEALRKEADSKAGKLEEEAERQAEKILNEAREQADKLIK